MADGQDKFMELLKKHNMGAMAVKAGVIEGPLQKAFKANCESFKTQDGMTSRCREDAIVLSKRDEPVLILGESGTGKEHIARILHGERFGRFTPINTTAVVDTLFESELFGHVRGSFTGAFCERKGLIEEAENGTVFFDEIGDMPLFLQAKILRVMQDNAIRKVGSNELTDVNARFVFATHQPLKKLIDSGRFRLDLFERISAFIIRIPPLRSRENLAAEMELHAKKELVEVLQHHFLGEEIFLPGNIRQLKNIALRAEVFGLERITREDVV